MAYRAASARTFAAARGPQILAVAAAGLSLAACATSPHTAANGMRVPGGAGAAAEGQGPRYKLGAPYQVGGIWYVPADQPEYDEVGIASWYGDEFNGQPTANGERFDMYSASAAHTTLPLPSIVEVTNLDNGRSIRVRLNDRGPFKGGRLIDLSRGAAERLGYLEKGLARVRVRYIGPARLDGSLEPLYVARKATPARPVEFAAASAPPPSPAVQASWGVAQASTPAPKPAPAPRPAYAPAPVITSSPLPPLAPPAQPAFAAAPSGGYAVQAGAFADRARAERLADAVAAAGPAAVRTVETSARVLYRVVLGPWSDAETAAQARAQVVALGYADARVIRAF